MISDRTTDKANEGTGLNLHEHFDDVFNAIPDLVFYKDRSLNINGCNKAFADFVGAKSPEELVGKNIPSFLNAIDSLILEEGDMQVIGTSIAINKSVAIEDQSKKTRWFQVKKSPIQCEINGCIGLLVIMSEFTTLKEFQESQKQLIAELQETNVELQKVKGQLLNAQENQRKKISSELHDDLGQHLAAIKSSLQNSQVDSSVIMLVDDGIEKIRSLSRSISPLYLKNNNLENLLTILVKQLNESKSLKFSFEYNLEEKILNPSIKLHLYRIIQEVSNNVCKHSKGTECKIQLHQDRNQIVLQVMDDGESYNFFEQLKKSTSFGLLTINERIKSLQGSIIYFAKDENDPYNILKLTV